jgi:putative ubiquitin-RnfH superfamily antitoxin RatB of RatAB toxin-antitoxin module
MKIAVVYADPASPQRVDCQVDDDATVEDAIQRSGLLRCCPDIDLSVQRVGVFGKFVKLDSALKEGDRVEIYQRITRVLDDEDEDEDDQD